MAELLKTSLCIVVGLFFANRIASVTSASIQESATANPQESAKVVSQEAAQAVQAASVMDKPSVGETSQDGEKSNDPDTPVVGVTFANPVTIRWRVNAIIRGGSGPAHTMLVTMPIPNSWPEQSVAIVEEDVPPNIAKVTYRNLDSGVRQIMAVIPQIRAREDIKIAVTIEVVTRQVIAPPDTSVFVRPKTSNRDGRVYTGISPQINYRNSKLKKQVKAIVKDKTLIWEQIEAIYDWVRDNIEDTPTQPQDSKTTFRDKKGCGEDKVGLFIAMCRAHKIPARMVWVQGAQYAEFMLVDSKRKPHWFPCDVSGLREFGSTSEPRIIIQKGDSIRVPEKESRQKLVAEFATCKGKSKPSVKFHREVIAD